VNALKVLGTAILSFLLFLSLTFFGIAYMLHSTILNPDFVADHVNELDVSVVTREIVEEQIGDQLELPEELEFLEEAVYDIIDEQEPWIKEQLNTAIYAAYDFLLSKTDSLEITVSIAELKEDLKDRLWTVFKENAHLWLPDLVAYELDSYLDEYLPELADQIPEEYLPPDIAGLSEALLRPFLEEYLRGSVAEITSSPVVSELLEVLVRPYYDQYYDEIADQLPSELTFTEDDIPADTWDILLQARQYIGYFQTGFYALIALMAVLVIGIVLIHRNVRDTTRALGIDMVIYGALELASVFVARSYIPSTIPSFDIPASIETWLTGLYNDILAPLQIFSIGVLIVGVVLLVVSFVYKSRTAED